jgi:AraC-like DNA-binding protein
MSRSRQPAGPQVRTSWVAYSTRFTWRARKSEWGQLLFSSHGAMTVYTRNGTWVVPSHQAIWVPPGVAHDVEMPAGAAMRMVYLSASLRRRLPPKCRAINLSALLRELLRRAMQLQTLDRRRRVERNLMETLLDQLTVLPRTPIDLPMPRDARGLRAVRWMRAAPDGRHTLAEVARQAGASTRTLERLFRAETGLSFGVWRQRARLLRAVQLLADEATVTAAAIAVGYESTSAFVAAFRRALGTTPGRYFGKRGNDDDVPRRRRRVAASARS